MPLFTELPRRVVFSEITLLTTLMFAAIVTIEATHEELSGKEYIRGCHQTPQLRIISISSLI